MGTWALKLNKHPAKTFIGRVAKGFDFLGYHIEPEGLKVSLSTLQNFAERITRLYEQGADSYRIGLYVRRWRVWATFYPLVLASSRQRVLTRLGMGGLAASWWWLKEGV